MFLLPKLNNNNNNNRTASSWVDVVTRKTVELQLFSVARKTGDEFDYSNIKYYRN